MFGYKIDPAGMQCTSHSAVSVLSGTANAATPGLTLRGQFYVEVDKTPNPLQGAITFGVLLKLSRACTVHIGLCTKQHVVPSVQYGIAPRVC